MINNIIVIVALVVVVGASALETVTYTNSTTIVIEEMGPSQTYPSIIEVPLQVYPQRIKITFHDVTHNLLEEVLAVLVSPSGKTVTLLNILDVWSCEADGVTFTFSDYAPSGNIKDLVTNNGEYSLSAAIETQLPQRD